MVQPTLAVALACSDGSDAPRVRPCSCRVDAVIKSAERIQRQGYRRGQPGRAVTGLHVYRGAIKEFGQARSAKSRCPPSPRRTRTNRAHRRRRPRVAIGGRWPQG